MEKQITILHANDLHGSQNFTVNQDLTLQGGISLLSGYVRKTRRRGPTFFGICGDILQEDIWGSDYKGQNTVELINALRPDAISLGNHELDYGLAHLMIFRDCLSAPVLCANMCTAGIDHMLFTPTPLPRSAGRISCGSGPAACAERSWGRRSRSGTSASSTPLTISSCSLS